MTTAKDFRRRLEERELLIGTMVTLSDPSVAEILSLTGFDWLFVDGEHGAIEVSDLKAILQAVADRVAVLVRIPSIDETPIKKALDLGAHGIIVPKVNSADQAERVVEFARYPPLGQRGVGLARAHGYGATFNEYVDTANEQITVVVQAEHIHAVGNIEEIIKVEGVDCVFVGPYDLSASMGLNGQVDHPDVLNAIDHVAKVCRSANMPLGFFGSSAASVQPSIKAGFNLICAGVDSVLLSSNASNLLGILKGNDRS